MSDHLRQQTKSHDVGGTKECVRSSDVGIAAVEDNNASTVFVICSVPGARMRQPDCVENVLTAYAVWAMDLEASNHYGGVFGFLCIDDIIVREPVLLHQF